eukprot:TRINITY_DN21675_c0_g1_i2.p2 TRINITY_DN21675_c0_g1~~TRINITY_DN21675_c0_g1_i2.p2  ORF type:complete len:156 (-),score=49.03 TRINITY_DN21675_c0_g1_i2:699-1166(-)
MLGKTDFDDYPGHCYRRTGATVLAAAGSSEIVLMRAGRWKSATVAQGYIVASLEEKKKVSGMMLDQVLGELSLSSSSVLGRRSVEDLPVLTNIPKRRKQPSDSISNIEDDSSLSHSAADSTGTKTPSATGVTAITTPSGYAISISNCSGCSFNFG